MRPTFRFPSAALWPALPLLYLVVPGHPLAVLGGIPLTTIAVGLALAVVLAAWCGLRPAGRWQGVLALCFGGAIGLKLVLAAVALPHGVAASYVAGGDPLGPAERATSSAFGDATRIDRELNLVGDQFPLHFLNELRFNHYRPSEPRRDRLPFAATWRGWLVEPTGGERCYQLQATGAAELHVGELPPLVIRRASHLEQRETCGLQPRGSVPIEVRYSRPMDGVPYLLVAERSSDGQYAPLGEGRLFYHPVGEAAVARDNLLGQLARALDLLVVLACGAVLVVAARSLLGRRGERARPARREAVERLILALAVLIAFAEALVTHAHFAGRTPILSGGNDWLAYESFARDILLNGPLLNGGKPPGQGDVFAYQPLYSYYLAGLHLLLGESLHGLLVAQYTLVAVAGVLVYFLARELFGRTSAWAAFGLYWAFRYLIANQTAGLLLSENLVTVFVPAMLLLLVRWQRTWQRSDLVGGGVLLGLAMLTRSTPLLFLPPAMLLVAHAQLRKFGQRRAAVGAASVLLVVSLAIFSLIAVRNAIVAGRPVFLSQSTTVNMHKAHQPSDRVDLSRIDRNPLYDRLGLDRQGREVLEFIRQDPLGYSATLVPMGLYALGVTGPALGTDQLQYELLVLTALYLAGLLLVPAARTAPAWLVHAFVGTHFLQMMVFFSHQYGFRLPLPMYGPMIAVAGATLVALVRWATIAGRLATLDKRRPRLRAVGISLVLLGAASWSALQLATPRPVEADVLGLGGTAGEAALAVASTPETWLADRVYFSGRDGRSLGVAYLPGLRHREMKWIDTTPRDDAARAFVWPADGQRGVLRPVASDPPLLAECLSAAAARQPLEPLPGAARGGLFWLPRPGKDACGSHPARLASFGGFVELLGLSRSTPSQAGSEALRVVWRVAQRPSVRVQPVVELLDPVGQVAAASLVDPYPSGSWEPGEVVVAYLPIPRFGTAVPTAPQLALGFTRDSASARLPIDDPLPLYGQTRVVVRD